MRFLIPAVGLLFFLALKAPIQAQDVKVYVSPHNLNLTITKINNSIEKNGYDQLGLTEYHSSPKYDGKFQGVVFVVSFKTKDMRKLVSCEPTAMLDMPLKVSAWEENGDVFISFLDSRTFNKRFALTDCDDVIKSLNKAMIRVVNDAIRIR